MDFIGSFEREKHADFFVAELADFYRNLPDEKIEKLIAAKNQFENGFKLIEKFKYAEVIDEFEKSRDAFLVLGNEPESKAAEIWAAQFLPDISKIEESRRRLLALDEFAERRKFKILQPTVFYWLSKADYLQNRFSDSIKNVKIALQKARETDNFLEIEHSAESLSGTYNELGEKEKSLSLSGELIRPEAYFESKTQYWRNKGNLAELMLDFGFLSTAFDAANEEVSVAREVLPEADLIDSSLRRLSLISAEKKDFETALKSINESKGNCRKARRKRTKRFFVGGKFSDRRRCSKTSTKLRFCTCRLRSSPNLLREKFRIDGQHLCRS